MMRKLVAFVLLLSTVFATCDVYISSAESDFGPGCIYPACFGAAARYKEAAFCYKFQGDLSLANTYFKKAADYYLQGTTYIEPGGDYPLRAPSYEYAADMYLELGNLFLAEQYYDQAIKEYMKINDLRGANSVEQKKAALEQTSPPKQQPATGYAVSAESIAIGGLMIIIAIAFFFYFRKKPPATQPSKSEFKFAQMKSVEEEPEETRQLPKDKMRDKIRKKYGLS